MADRDLFSRLRRLFSTNVIVRNVGGRRLRIADTQQVQAIAGKDLVDRYSRLYKSPHGMSGYNQSLYQKTMRLGLFRDYEAMDGDAILSSALDIYADESTMKSEYGNVLEINNEDGLQIGAKNGTILVSLQIFDPAIGDFDLGNEDEAIVYYTLDAEDEDAPLYISNSGTVTITSIDFSTNTVSGSFVGTVSDVFGDQSEVVMTNGVFENISFESVAGVDSATALVDGEQFQANTFAEASVEGSSEVTLNFVSDLDDRITITIPQQPEVGVYPISETPPYSASFTAFVDDPTEVNYEAQADSGEIEIISFENDIVTGTFSFTGVADNGDTITITEGEFTYEF